MATVGSLVTSLAPLLTLVEGSDRDVDVSEVVVLGPGDEPSYAPGAVVVCIGDVMPKAAAAVIMKGQPPELVMPVLVAEAAVPWNHLLQLLEAVVSVGTDATGDLFTFANAVAVAVGGAVAIEDVDRRVLAYSSLDHPVDDARREGILGRAVPHFQRNDQIYREVYRAHHPVRVAAEGDVMARLAVAVRSGPEVLGSLWVVDGGDLDESALGDAGRLAALHLLRTRSLSHAERRSRGEIVRGLLDGRASPQLAGARLGIGPEQPVTVIAMHLPSESADHQLGAEAIAELIQLHGAAVAPRAAVLIELTTAYVVIPGELERVRLGALATTIIERAPAVTAGQLSAAVGSTVSSLAAIGRSRLDADAVLALQQPGQVGMVENCMERVVLLELSRHLVATPRLRLAAVERMVSSDEREGTAYADTVHAYLSLNGAVGEAARSLHVHANTFRYRLQRARELFDLDLDDADTRLVTWLMLRAR